MCKSEAAGLHQIGSSERPKLDIQYVKRMKQTSRGPHSITNFARPHEFS